MSSNTKSDPTIFVVFGGTGDLAKRKIGPALYNLFLDGWMPAKFSIIGTGRTQYSDEQFRENLLNDINQFSRSGKAVKEKWDEFSKNIYYQVSDIKDAETYKEFGKRVEKHNVEWKTKANVIYYLAVSPNFFPIIASNISKAKLADDPKKVRIVIEKPFGHDLETAKELNTLLSSIFDECQIYRIDHYLGKETVQNIMAFRFANSIMEPLWNRNFIEHVQISVTEQLGVEERGDYYDSSGALRDMIQNHLLQLLCHIAMEPPVSFNADQVRDRKVDVLKAMRKFSPEDVRTSAVRGQYGSGWMKGKEVPGYREEPKVDPESNTETFAAIKFFVDNWRWQGVPFYLRTGKRLHQSSSVITIQFKDVPHLIFPTEAAERWQQNRLIISIQPEMSIRLQVQAKRPGIDMVLNAVDMVFDYKGTYTQQAPEAYETLILDTMLGDQTLFMRGDQVEAAWELVMPILSTWQTKKSLNFPNYSADSWGPESAEALIARDGFNWFTLPVNGKNNDLMKLNVFDNEDEVLRGLANYFVEVSADSIAKRGQFSVALSGGNSPKKLYELLASPGFKERIEWNKVHFFFGDERYVPATDPQSNYLMAKKALLEPLELSFKQVFPINTTLSPEDAAEAYTTDINYYFAGTEARFDLVLLGLGDNSHTASLFPHTPVLHDKTASAKAVYLDDQKVFRITMTAPLINQANHIAFLVYGDGKASAVQHVIEDKTDIENYPAQLIKPQSGDLQWFLDHGAAARLKNK